MAILDTASGGLVSRDSSAWFDPSLDWTDSAWIRFKQPLPSGFALFWLYGPADYSTEYIWLGSASDTSIILEHFDGVATYLDTTPYMIGTEWRYRTVRYTAATHSLELLIDGVLVDTLTADLDAFAPQSTEFLLNEGGGSVDDITETAYQRRWQAALSDAEIIAERTSETPVLATNLLSDTVFATTSDLTDTVGAHNWTAAGTLSTVSGPFDSQLDLATIYFANDGPHDAGSDLGKLYTADGVELVLPLDSPHWSTTGMFQSGGMARLDDGRICLNNYAPLTGPHAGDDANPAVIPATLLEAGIVVNDTDTANDLYSMASDHTGFFYGIQLGGGGVEPVTLKKINADDVSLDTSWDLFAANTAPGPTRYSLGVSPDESYAYLTAQGVTAFTLHSAGWIKTVRRVDLSSLVSTAFATESTRPAQATTGNIVVLTDSTVLIAWEGTTASYIKHYAEDSSELHTYTFATSEFIYYLAPGLTDSSFWVSVFNPSSALAFVTTVYNIRVSDGAVLHSFDASSDTFNSTGAFVVIAGSAAVPPAGPFIAFILDSTTNTYRDVIAGGGSLPVFGMWNGSDWLVIGK